MMKKIPLVYWRMRSFCRLPRLVLPIAAAAMIVVIGTCLHGISRAATFDSQAESEGGAVADVQAYDGPTAEYRTALPFDMPSTVSLRSSDKKVFARYFPHMPISIDNADPANDYNQRGYPTVNGENGKHAACGGYLPEQPLPRAPLPETGTNTGECPQEHPSNWRLEDMKTEVRRAIAAGIDGFTVDIILPLNGPDHRVCQNPFLLLQAAQEVDPGFSLMLMPDLAGGLNKLNEQQMADLMALYAAYPSAYRLPDGRLVISPLHAEAHDVGWWGRFMDIMQAQYDISVAFVPCFLNYLENAESFAPISYGFSNWGNRSPAANSLTSLRANIDDAHARGKIWMQPVSLQDVRPHAGIYDEANNPENLHVTWEAAIAGGADWVQIPTWKDFLEQTNIEPSSRKGWSPLDINSNYLVRYKTGAWPVLSRDQQYSPVSPLPSDIDKNASVDMVDPMLVLQLLFGRAPTPITLLSIPGITAPATGETPIRNIDTAQYTGSISWNPNDTPFAAGITYTATINLAPKRGWTVKKVSANSFSVAGATTTNAANSAVIFATFPATINPNEKKLTYAQRNALTIGNYIPSEKTAGLLPGWTPANLTPYPSGDATYVKLDPGLYENYIFWCEVRIPNNGSGAIVFRNCAFAGQNPETIGSATKTDNRDGIAKTYQYAQQSQFLRCYDDNHHQWLMEDCLLDGTLWFDPLANPPGGAKTGNPALKLRSSAGIHGGSGTVRRSYLKGQQDSISINQPSIGGASDPSFFTIEGCYFEAPIFYQAADHWQAEGTHSDTIQFHRGKNITLRGNFIKVGRNAGMMIIQEVSAAANNLIEFVIIEKNWFEAENSQAGYGINHGLKYQNSYATTRVRDNYFLSRPDNKYIIARQGFYGSYSGNRRVNWNVPGLSVTDVGAVNISNGGP